MTHAVVFAEDHKASRLKLLETMAKECREYGLALLVASQEARNVAPSDQERRVADRLKSLSKFEALSFADGQRVPQHIHLVEP